MFVEMWLAETEYSVYKTNGHSSKPVTIISDNPRITGIILYLGSEAHLFMSFGKITEAFFNIIKI